MLACSVLLACACGDTESGAHFVSPYDGQTDWPADAPLQVRVGAPVAPEGLDLDQNLIHVVDIDVGGPIEGTVVADKGDLWFFPDEPLPRGHRFAWSVAPPHDEARSVHLGLPPGLRGSATFHTGAIVEPVAALRLDDEVCVVWSRGPQQGPDAAPLAFGLKLYADGVPVAVRAAVEVSLTGIDPRTAGTASLGCLALDDAGIEAATIEGVRVDGTEEVWQLPVEARSVDDLLGEHHRLGGPTDEEGT
jgi:hypothetical protein